MYREWIKTLDLLPNKYLLKDEIGKGRVTNDYADCFIYINGRIEERPFNFDHECWASSS